MKYRTVTERIGEHLGPVDWSYDFASHFTSLGIHDEQRRAACIQQKIDWLRQLEADPSKYEATTDGGWHMVLCVGMYDGWPYWRPVPSVLLSGTLGPEWHSFDSITGVSER